ncbi:MAG: cell division protein FtsZ, partial [Peptostreptococcaceae bacterium]|nr:cell division protein FtsZ [Peptostreptococcaceae bacterium]
IQSPLLETSIKGAKGVLLNITGGANLGLFEINEASTLVQESCDSEANIIFGATIKEDLKDDLVITVIATGFEDGQDMELDFNRNNNNMNQNQGFQQSHINNNMNREIQRPVMQEVKKEEEPEAKQNASSSYIENDDMEIPTFLRRRR